MSDDTYLKYFVMALAVLSIAYLLQIYSPLRLNTDAIAYLSMAASAADGDGFNFNARRLPFPIGYPALLAGLDRAGLGASRVFTGLNCLLLALGLAASYALLRRVFKLPRRVATLLCCLTLLCYVFVKHVPLPMAEIPFFGVSMAGLYTLSWAEQCPDSRRWYAIGVAALLTVAAISFRTIGIAMIPALLWVGLSKQSLQGFPSVVTRHRWLLLLLLLAVAVVLMLLMSQALALPKYLNEFMSQYRRHSLSNRVMYNLSAKLTEWGALIVNVPRSRFPASLKVALPFLGLIGLGTLFFGLWTRRRAVSAVEVFVLTYVLILFLWRGHNARFWLPVVPLLMGWLALVFQRIMRTVPGRAVVVLYLLWFAFTGCAALVYSSRITLAGSAFPDRYGDGSLSPTYRVAFDGLTGDEVFHDKFRGPVGPEDIHKRAFDLLIRYEPRVHVQFEDEEILP